MTPANKKALAIVFGIIVLDLMGAGILLPIIPYLVREYRTDATTVGWLSTSFSAAAFVAAPVLGVLSDRWGRRPVLIVSMFGSALGYVLFGIGGSLMVLFLSRILDGITGGNISTAQSYIADVTPPQDRAKNFGLIGAAFGLGFVAGPALGGVLSQISLRAPAFGAAALSFATCIVAYFVLPESLPPERRNAEPLTLNRINPLRLVAIGFSKAGLTGLMISVFLLNFAFSGLQSNFAVFTLARFGLTPSQNAMLFTFLGVLAAFFQGYLIRKLIPKFGEFRLAFWGFILTGAGFAIFGASAAVWMLYVGMFVMAMGNSFGTPSITSLISRQVSAQEQGMMLGVTQSIASVTRVLGPLWAGYIFDFWGPGAPYWTGAVCVLAASGVLLAWSKKHAMLASPVGGRG